MTKKHVNVRPIPPYWYRVISKPYYLSKRTLEIYYRKKTDVANRVKPSFLIVGTQKGGTTSLYDYLIQHPEIIPVERKEIHFFDSNFDKGLPWYLSFFPEKIEGQVRPNCGEASPSYLFIEEIPQRVKGLFPDIKIIILLRNPVDRAISHFSMEKYRKLENLDFKTAIEKEQERMQENIRHRIRYSYLEQGLYHKHIKNWLKHFDENQLLFIKSEDFFDNPKEATSRAFKLLGLENYDNIQYKPLNKGKYKHEVSPETVEYLKEFFWKPNIELARMLGEKYNWNS